MDNETVLKISSKIWPYSANAALSPEMYAFASAIEKQVREECAMEADYYAKNSVTAKIIASSIRKK